MGKTKRLLAAAVAVLVSAFCVATPEVAADEPPVVSHVKRAKQLYELGKRLFEAKEFREAAKTFAESFEHDPRPGALFNRGRCLEEDGDKKAAISAFKRYLALEPNGDASDEARTRALALERQLELDGELAEDPRDANDATVGGAGADAGSSSLRWTGLATVGAGALLFATGGYFGLEARSISKDLEGRDRGQWTAEEIARFKDGEQAEKLGIGLMGVGVAAVVIGGVLYYLGRELGREPTADIEIQPTVGSDSAGASLRIQF